MAEPPARRGTAAYQALALAWSLGWRIAAGTLIGYYLDGWLGTSPWLTLTCSLSGMVVAVRQMIAVVSTKRAPAGNQDREDP